MLELQNDPTDLLDETRRQPERRLVEQDHLRARHQRAADHQHLLLAARQIAGLLIAAIAQRREQRIGALDAIAQRLVIVAHVTARYQIFLDRQVLEYAAALEHLRDAVPHHLVRWQAVEARSVELDRALGDLAALGHQQARDRLERRGLAGAVRAEHGRDLARARVERHALEHQDHAVVDDLDVVDGQHGCHRCQRPETGNQTAWRGFRFAQPSPRIVGGLSA